MQINCTYLTKIETNNQLGESVLWRSSDSTVWWTDVLCKKLYKMSWPSKKVECFNLTSRLASFGFVKSQDNKIIAAFENGFALYEPETSSTYWIKRPKLLGNGIRLNDGRVGPHGRFWVGSMNEGDLQKNTASDTGLFKLESDGTVGFVRSGLKVTNSICWDPSNTRMYYSDTKRQEIYHSTYDTQNGILGQQKIFTRLKNGYPDGAVIDTLGNLWVAVWGEARIDCYDLNGVLIFSLQLPAPQPTCISFGGKNMNLLFISTARKGMSQEQIERYPTSGNLFVYETNVVGKEATRYAPTTLSH